MENNNNLYAKEIVQLACAFIQNGKINVEDLDHLLPKIKEKLEDFNQKQNQISVGKHLCPDHFICLCCGEKVVFLNKHLREWHGMDINAYRRQFNLDLSYPTVPELYSKKRSLIAKGIRLGKNRKKKYHTGTEDTKLKIV